MDSNGLFNLRGHFKTLSEQSNPLDVLERTIDFEYFRNWLVKGPGYGAGVKGEQSLFDAILMLKALILLSRHKVLDAKIEFVLCDRLFCMWF